MPKPSFLPKNMREFNLRLGKNLVAARKKAGLTRHELAKQAGVTYGVVRDTENAVRSTRCWSVFCLALCLGTTVESLVQKTTGGSPDA